MRNIVTIAREAALDILIALDAAIALAIHLGWVIDQIRFEDAYMALRDAVFPVMPYGPVQEDH